MRKVLSLLFIVAAVLLAGCRKTTSAFTPPDNSGRGQTAAQEELLARADNQTSADQLITRTYDAAYLSRYFGSSFSNHDSLAAGYPRNLETLNPYCEIECLRDMGNDICYAVFDVTEGGRWFLFFYHGNWWHNIYIKEPLDQKAFDRLEAGDSIRDVIALDPALALGESEGFSCNILSTVEYNGKLYTVHLFEDEVYCISYINGEENWQEAVIERIDKYEDAVMTMEDIVVGKNDDGDVHLSVSGEYDFTRLPKDYL